MPHSVRVTMIILDVKESFHRAEVYARKMGGVRVVAYPDATPEMATDLSAFTVTRTAGGVVLSPTFSAKPKQAFSFSPYEFLFFVGISNELQENMNAHTLV